MFPDSQIASSFTCSETKTMYLACFGIAPFIRSTLESKLKNQPFVLMFDESLNQDLQKKQMDLILRNWDGNIVQSHYYTSDFLGHACATDIIHSFEKKVESRIGLVNLIQLSMDGPNVNWSAFDKLQHKVETQNHCQLINIGSCGLHQLHNAFRAGLMCSGWDIGHKMSALHTLFADVPARREDYESITKSSIYPLSFCNHRWVENVKVCERALEIHSHVKCYVESTNKKDPQTKSYETIKQWVHDPLSKAKLLFAISVGKTVENFLTVYQTDKPMTPFLARDLEDLLRTLKSRIVKSSVLETASSIIKLVDIDVSDETILKTHKTIDIGFATELEVKNLLSGKKVSEKGVLGFKTECREILSKIVTKIEAKSPLEYSVLRNMCCLDPSEITTNHEACKKRFKRVLEKLHALGQVDINVMLSLISMSNSVKRPSICQNSGNLKKVLIELTHYSTPT